MYSPTVKRHAALVNAVKSVWHPASLDPWLTSSCVSLIGGEERVKLAPRLPHHHINLYGSHIYGPNHIQHWRQGLSRERKSLAFNLLPACPSPGPYILRYTPFSASSSPHLSCFHDYLHPVQGKKRRPGVAFCKGGVVVVVEDGGVLQQ